MDNHDKNFLICFFIIVSICVTIGGIFTERQNKLLKAKAVEKGYAEWYSEEPGQTPVYWRWKE